MIWEEGIPESWEVDHPRDEVLVLIAPWGMVTVDFRSRCLRAGYSLIDGWRISRISIEPASIRGRGWKTRLVAEGTRYLWQCK